MSSSSSRSVAKVISSTRQYSSARPGATRTVIKTRSLPIASIPPQEIPVRAKPAIGIDPKQIKGGLPEHFNILGYPDLIRKTPLTPLATHLLRDVPPEDRVLAIMKQRYPSFSLSTAPFLPPPSYDPASKPRVIHGQPLPSLAHVNPGELPPARPFPRTRTRSSPHQRPAGTLPPPRGYGPGAYLEKGLGARVVNLREDMILGYAPRTLGERERKRLEEGREGNGVKRGQFAWETEEEKGKRRGERLDRI